MTSESENRPGTKIGYARVSTSEQNPDMQIQALKNYGVDPALIYVDRASGGSMTRPAFMRALRACQHDGGEFVVWKLDRLGRTLGGILGTLKLLSERGIAFVSLTERVDTTGPMGKAMIHLLAVFAELERDLIRERTKAAIDRAKERGEVGGRPKAMTEDRVAAAIELFAQGERGNTVWKAMQKIEGPTISRAAYYAWQKDWDAESRAPDVHGE
ncbi:DNA invertase [Puniceibacterium antarcticum]|uniref:DNA invertase n=2 Tax=Puniceibacterium antarcticum TaxID=1206336 RepID=A0A2G8QSW6_9RHOB|nr:DNA invertase [Puniceibacterium antarcticum]